MIDYVKMMVRLKNLRDKSGISQKALAKKIGVTHYAISNYERGISVPRIEIADDIADYFGVSLDWLTGRTDKKEVNG